MADWIEWQGGECPVPDEALVDLRFVDGKEFTLTQAGDWNWNDDGYDIIAYRVARA